jgi:hypothetical protein
MYSPTSSVQSLSPCFIGHCLLWVLFTILPPVGYGTSSEYSYTNTSRQGWFRCLLLQSPLLVRPPSMAHHWPMAQRCHRAEALLGFGASVQDAFAGAFATVDQTVASTRAMRAAASRASPSAAFWCLRRNLRAFAPNGG